MLKKKKNWGVGKPEPFVRGKQPGLNESKGRGGHKKMCMAAINRENIG
jgi:single-stranded DNA-specific DHH superfamily exonuclease